MKCLLLLLPVLIGLWEFLARWSESSFPGIRIFLWSFSHWLLGWQVCNAPFSLNCFYSCSYSSVLELSCVEGFMLTVWHYQALHSFNSLWVHWKLDFITNILEVFLNTVIRVCGGDLSIIILLALLTGLVGSHVSLLPWLASACPVSASCCRHGTRCCSCFGLYKGFVQREPGQLLTCLVCPNITKRVSNKSSALYRNIKNRKVIALKHTWSSSWSQPQLCATGFM